MFCVVSEARDAGPAVAAVVEIPPLGLAITGRNPGDDWCQSLEVLPAMDAGDTDTLAAAPPLASFADFADFIVVVGCCACVVV